MTRLDGKHWSRCKTPKRRDRGDPARGSVVDLEDDKLNEGVMATEPSVEAPSSEKQTAPRRGWLAGVMSALCPGLGLLYNGKPLAAGVVAVAPVLLLSGFFAVGALNPDVLIPIVAALVIVYLMGWPAQIVWAIVAARNAPRPFRVTWYNSFEVYALFYVLNLLLTSEVGSTLRVRLLEPFNMSSAAMAPTLLPGDFIYVVKAGPEANATVGDVVLYADPARSPTPFVGRLVAVGSSVVSGQDKEVRVNGAALEQHPCRNPIFSYADPAMDKAQARVAECTIETAMSGKEYSVIFDPSFTGGRSNFGPITLEAPHAFVIGDNRDNSNDSRWNGPIDVGSIKGRAVVIWFSFSLTDGIRWSRIGLRL